MEPKTPLEYAGSFDGRLSQQVYQEKYPSRWMDIFLGDLTENRTPIARMKTWCPNR